MAKATFRAVSIERVTSVSLAPCWPSGEARVAIAVAKTKVMAGFGRRHLAVVVRAGSVNGMPSI